MKLTKRLHDVGNRARVRRRSRCAGASREKEGEREIATWKTETERDQMSLTRESGRARKTWRTRRAGTWVRCERRHEMREW